MEAENISLIDTHLHLDFETFDGEVPALLERAQQAEVKAMITIGCGLESCKRAIALAEEHPNIFAAVGVHPHGAKLSSDEEIDAIRNFLQHPKVVGIGETGLDYFYMKSPKETQQLRFRQLARMSLETDIPLIIHTRDAEEDTLQILREESQGRPYKGVIHCFSGTLPFAQACIEMGFYISISGMITFIKSVQKVVKKLPVERLLVETDAPFLAPNPHRGQRNEPSYVRHTAERLAKLFKMSLLELSQHTTRNSQELFGLPDVESLV